MQALKTRLWHNANQHKIRHESTRGSEVFMFVISAAEESRLHEHRLESLKAGVL